MNADTGHVATQEEYDALKARGEGGRYVGVPRHMRAMAGAAMAAGQSLFESKHVGQQIRSQALDLARKHKAKQRRKMAKASQRRNHAR